MALALLSLTALVTIIGALTVTSFATETTSTTLETTATDSENELDYPPLSSVPRIMTYEQEFSEGLARRQAHRARDSFDMTNIEVSADYVESINAILEADTDVQDLITEGYNVTSIRPEVKRIIEADGTLSTKATTAVVISQNGTEGVAFADVDVTQTQVTQITIFTKTVIDKTTS